jgi:hypothetical protein
LVLFFYRFEYALMSIACQKIFAGHSLFHFLRDLFPYSYPERSRGGFSGSLLDVTDFVIIDKSMHPNVTLSSAETLYGGDNLALLRKASEKYAKRSRKPLDAL